jgi:hypothetical protein
MPTQSANPRLQQRLQFAAALALGVLAATAATLLWLSPPGAEGDAIRSLPEAERRSLYERTLRTLESPCKRHRGSGLESICRQQADFVVQFPECDAQCSALAEAFRAGPSR